jgi:hypothetical protein
VDDAAAAVGIAPAAVSAAYAEALGLGVGAARRAPDAAPDAGA